ncbi:MAG: imidazole glycerol phosphate synthase subunit HisH [Oscillospiraceae bacterium]|nr:imidazole glycerol phosphate synthase subunit HisH [Oscillospiraceae bacterium]MBQ9858703.1 imidazole glycerol phosphate synthase subunit HisH [Oscillospiraceae bacterium]
MSYTAIVDYGVGNLFSIASSLKYLEIESIVTKDAEVLRNASHIILPGVGAFGDAMEKLKSTGLVPVLNELVKEGKPIMGICLGMQMLFEKSYEYGEHEGLGWINGTVRPLEEAFETEKIDLKIPHMGWNSLTFAKTGSPVLKYTQEGDFVYFVHSYYAADCDDALIAWADYGVKIPAVVAKDNVFGCQFHPEKSGNIGLSILKAFSEI